jgi:dTDP-4-amino-4,6-dideoxygalactose transaminase
MIRLNKSFGIQDGVSVDSLEYKIRDYVGSHDAIATTSGTMAIFLALYALKEYGKLDVVMPSYGHPATFRVCDFLGLNPVFVEMDTTSLSIDLDSLRNAITDHTLAVVHVETNAVLGNPQAIREICRERGVYFIEDSAASFSQKYNDKYAGTFGDVGIYSFAPTKVLNCGEGGMLIVNDESLSDRLRKLRWCSDSSTFPSSTLNLNMSPHLASMVLDQFDSVKFIIEQRKRVHDLYKKHGLDIFEDDLVTNYYPYAIYKTPSAKDISFSLKKFHIQHRYKFAAADEKFPGAIELQTELIDLPNFYDMTEEQIKYVCTIVRRAE